MKKVSRKEKKPREKHNHKNLQRWLALFQTLSKEWLICGEKIPPVDLGLKMERGVKMPFDISKVPKKF